MWTSPGLAFATGCCPGQGARGIGHEKTHGAASLPRPGMLTIPRAYGVFAGHGEILVQAHAFDLQRNRLGVLRAKMLLNWTDSRVPCN